MSKHSGEISTLVLTPHGDAILTTGGKEVGLWDRATGENRWLVEADRYAATVAIGHPSGCVVSGGDFGTIAVLEGDSGKLRFSLEIDQNAGPLFLLPDGRVAVGSDGYEDLFLLDVATGVRADLEAQGEQGSSRGVRVFGSTLVSAGVFGSVVKWNLVTLAYDGRVFGAAGELLGWLGDDRLITLDGNALVVWRAEDGEIVRRIEGPPGTFVAIPSPDGKHVAALAKKDVAVIDGGTGTPVRSLGIGASRSLASFSEDGGQLAVGNSVAGKSVVSVFQTASGRPLATLERPALNRLLLDTGVLWLGGADGTLERLAL